MALERYILKRIASVIPVLLVVAVVVFTLIHLTSGDPAGVMLGDNATPAEIEALRAQLGLDRPLITQFWLWFRNLLRGDLGNSIFLHRPVGQAILERAEPTLMLTFLSLLVAMLIGIPTGLISAVKRNTTTDRLLLTVSLLGASIPSFWLGLGLIYAFAVSLAKLPSAGYQPLADGVWGNIRYLILPSLALGFPNSALITRITRSSMLDVLDQDYVRVARAKGLRRHVVVLRHALRNALVPMLTVIGLTLATLMGGAVVTETVFNIPGVGRLVVQSVMRRDYPVIQGVILVIACLYVFTNLIVDLLYTVVDPRIKY
jgi:peptide/nickel transport system permease protein